MSNKPEERREPSEADHLVKMAHIICDEAKIPPGDFIGRIVALSRKATRAEALNRSYPAYSGTLHEQMNAPQPKAAAPMNRESGYRCTYCCAKSGDPHIEGCPEMSSGSIEQWSSGQPVPECPICHDTGVAFGKVCTCGSAK